MKRSELKRGVSQLSRETPLGASVEKAREFIQRGRAKSNLTRSASGWQPMDAAAVKAAPAAKLKSKPRRRRPEGPLSPKVWRRVVFERSAGRCTVSGARADGFDDPFFDAHHPLPKRELRARKLYGHVWDGRNGMLVQRSIHERHEMPGVKRRAIPRSAIPACVWEFCAELDALDGTEWATALVERLHPAAGISRIDTRRA